MAELHWQYPQKKTRQPDPLYKLHWTYIAALKQNGGALAKELGIFIPGFTSLRVARRGDAESEVFFERSPLGLCELGTSTYNMGQGGPKSDLSKKLPVTSQGYILRNRPTGMLLRPY